MPALADLVLRDATAADLDAITRIVASSPDDAADWTYPELRQQADVLRPLHARAFAGLFRSRQNLLRVAERGGRVVGYSAWVRRARVDGEVVAVDVKEACDENALTEETARLIGDAPLPKFAALAISIPSRAAAIARLRSAQAPEPCLSVPGEQLLVLGVDQGQQGRGIGGALIREGLSRAAAAACPVFVTGEGRGMRVYRHLGFQVLDGTCRCFDRDGNEAEGDDEGGLRAAQMVWVPDGQSVTVHGVLYRGYGLP
ncbi:Acyl-N-acyltransferase [Cordyceps militaris]|uniref:Acyl-N-acyltransferase n=1 Tax=Cordyceps militaris TaxID=73501 RepID=A0A2H4SJP1_CORMI|nr:Acyl-N-acyltransferase [Cordyceps militaris]